MKQSQSLTASQQRYLAAIKSNQGQSYGGRARLAIEKLQKLQLITIDVHFATFFVRYTCFPVQEKSQ